MCVSWSLYWIGARSIRDLFPALSRCLKNVSTETHFQKPVLKYRRPSFYCSLPLLPLCLCRDCIFYKLGQPCVQEVCGHHFPYCVYSLHGSVSCFVILATFQTFSFLLYVLWWSLMLLVQNEYDLLKALIMFSIFSNKVFTKIFFNILAHHEACGILFPNQGSNPYLLHWKCRVLTTGPGNSLAIKYFWIKVCRLFFRQNAVACLVDYRMV